MELLTGVWTWLTRRLLHGEDIGTAGEYVVLSRDPSEPHDIVDVLDLPAFQSPVEALHTLEDGPDRIYAWEVDTEARARSLLSALESHNVADMDALHIVLTDKEELAELSKDEIRTYVDAGAGV